jgi:hypothetical protein
MNDNGKRSRGGGMSDAATEAEEDFVSELRARLEVWQADFERLQVRADRMLSKKREDFEGRLDKLQSRHDTDAVELQQINEQVWSDLSAGLVKAVEALQEALEKADSRLE